MSLADWISGKALTRLKDEAPPQAERGGLTVATVATVTVAKAPANDPAPVRAVIHYRLKTGKGGTIIDPDGMLSAVHALHLTHHNRVDWPWLLEHIGTGESDDQRKAREAIVHYIEHQ
jgi:hypothetical protein